MSGPLGPAEGGVAAPGHRLRRWVPGRGWGTVPEGSALLRAPCSRSPAPECSGAPPFLAHPQDLEQTSHQVESVSHVLFSRSGVQVSIHGLHSLRARPCLACAASGALGTV